MPAFNLDKLAIVSVNFLVRSVAPIFGEYLEERIGQFENAFIWYGGIFMAELLNKTPVVLSTVKKVIESYSYLKAEPGQVDIFSFASLLSKYIFS